MGAQPALHAGGSRRARFPRGLVAETRRTAQIECGRHAFRVGPRGGDGSALGVDSSLRYFAQGLCASELASDKRSACVRSSNAWYFFSPCCSRRQGGRSPLTVWSKSLDASGAAVSSVAALARDWAGTLVVDICLDYFSVRNPFADGARRHLAGRREPSADTWAHAFPARRRRAGQHSGIKGAGIPGRPVPGGARD